MAATPTGTADLDGVVYCTAGDVLAASRAAIAPQGIVVHARRSADGDVVFVDVDGVVQAAGASNLATAPVAPPGGFPHGGRGRVLGSGLDVRESLDNVLVVLLATSAYLNLTELFEPEEAAQLDLNGLRNLRYSLAKVTYKALGNKAWDLSRSGAIGVLVKYGARGSQDDEGRDLAVAVEATLMSEVVVFMCSASESCVSKKACTMQQPMEAALDKVRAALGVTMADLFEILGASLRTRARAFGRAVL